MAAPKVKTAPAAKGKVKIRKKEKKNVAVGKAFITKHGAPMVDDEDVPEELRSTSAPATENEWDTDANHFLRWDWVLAEMIWAFEQKVSDDDESKFFDHSECGDITDFIKDTDEYLSRSRVDWDGLKQHQERKQNGFRLFGKYYQALWD
jgi:hypothetical protein